MIAHRVPRDQKRLFSAQEGPQCGAMIRRADRIDIKPSRPEQLCLLQCVTENAPTRADFFCIFHRRTGSNNIKTLIYFMSVSLARMPCDRRKKRRKIVTDTIAPPPGLDQPHRGGHMPVLTTFRFIRTHPVRARAAGCQSNIIVLAVRARCVLRRGTFSQSLPCLYTIPNTPEYISQLFGTMPRWLMANVPCFYVVLRQLCPG